MGAFKPLLPFGAGTVAGACVESLHAGGASETVVVVGHRAEELRAALAGVNGVRFAVNEEAASGMGVSVARGVEAVGAGASAVLVALVDHPAVPASEVARLLDARRRTGARLIIPEWEGRGGHPVLVDLAFRAELLGIVPRRGLRALFDAHRAEVLRLPAASPFVARDMDTWEAYLALHRDVFGAEPVGGGESPRRRGF